MGTESKQDIRKIRTKRMLMNALAELLNIKTLEEITVHDIVQTAEISRTTFYRNYLDKEDFIEQIKNELIKGLLLVTADKSNQQPTRGQYREYFRYFYKNRIFFKVFIDSGRWPDFYNQFYEQGIGSYANFIDKEKLFCNIPGEIIIYYIVSAHVGLLQHWLEHNCPCPPEEMAHQVSQNAYNQAMDEVLHA